MPRYDVKTKDPVRYARVKADQDKIAQEFFCGVMLARLCPYCGTKIEVLCRGSHAASQSKCQNCGEEVKFPPVQFRLNRRFR